MRGIAMVLALFAAIPAAADSKSDAEAHYKQGKAFETAKEYTKAIAEYEAAYAIDKRPAHLFNIAYAAQLAGDHDKAIAYYQKYLEADGKGPRSKEARDHVVEVTKLRDEREDKLRKEEELRKQAAADQALRAEAERKRIAAEGHVKLADAYARAKEWTKAGDELRAAFDADGDAGHLRAAGEAYANGNDHAKARDAYLQYLERAPTATDADTIRDRVAIESRAISAAIKTTVTPDAPTDRPRTRSKRGWVGWGLQIGGGVSGAAKNPLRMGDSADGVDGGKTFTAVADMRYALLSRLHVRPEAGVRYQDVNFTGAMQGVSEKIQRAGLVLAVPIVLVLGRDTANVELLAGPCLMVIPYAKANGGGVMINVDDFTRVDPGVMLGLAFAFGDFALQVDYRRGFAGFAAEFDTTLDTFTVGLGIRLGD